MLGIGTTDLWKCLALAPQKIWRGSPPRGASAVASSSTSPPEARLTGAFRGGDTVGPGGEADGLVELAGERRLIGITAFLRHDADRRIGLAQPVARQLDPRSRQVLSGREPEQGADALVELERGKPRSRREIRNPQRGIEMIVDMSEHGRQRGHVGLQAGIRRVAGDAGKPDDPAG